MKLKKFLKLPFDNSRVDLNGERETKINVWFPEIHCWVKFNEKLLFDSNEINKKQLKRCLNLKIEWLGLRKSSSDIIAIVLKDTKYHLKQIKRRNLCQKKRKQKYLKQVL